MSIGSVTAKELAKMGANLEIRDGLGSTAIKEVVKIAKEKGSKVSVSSSLHWFCNCKRINFNWW